MQQLIPVFQCFEPLLTDKFTLYQIVGLHVYRGNYGVLKFFLGLNRVFGLEIGVNIAAKPKKGVYCACVGLMFTSCETLALLGLKKMKP